MDNGDFPAAFAAAFCKIFEARFPMGAVDEMAVASVLSAHGIAPEHASELLTILNCRFFQKQLRIRKDGKIDGGERIARHLRALAKELPTESALLEMVLRANEEDTPDRRVLVDLAAALRKVEEANRLAMPLLEKCRTTKRRPPVASPVVLVASWVRNHAQCAGQHVSQQKSVKVAVELMGLLLPKPGSRAGWVSPQTEVAAIKEIGRMKTVVSQ